MSTRYEWIATAAFGLEGVVARELGALGIEAKAENGGARFMGTLQEAFQANLWLRCADRVLLVVGRFEARSFE
ncbi:MAG: THUMP domain-containing protein, partial [Clostridia bacterium]|nr:THUMP domain-containing protein [Clostridia bacterium]